MSDKKYDWPDEEMVNGSGNLTHPAILMAQSLRVLGEILIDINNTLKEISGKLK